MRDSSAYGLRMTGHQSKKEKARRVGNPSFSPFFAVRLTGRTWCVNLALVFPVGESFLPADAGLVRWEPDWRAYAVHEAWQYWSYRVAHLPGWMKYGRGERARRTGGGD